MIRTLSQSEVTRVPPVTAERSPPLSRMTGADLPVIAELVDRGDTLDDLAVTRDQIINLDQHEIAGPERGRVDEFEVARVRRVQALRLGLGPRAAQCVGLSLAAPLRDSLRKIGEEHGKP